MPRAPSTPTQPSIRPATIQFNATPGVKDLFCVAEQEANTRGHKELDDVHILLALCRGGKWAKCSPSYFEHVISKKGGSFATFRQRLEKHAATMDSSMSLSSSDQSRPATNLMPWSCMLLVIMSGFGKRTLSHPPVKLSAIIALLAKHSRILFDSLQACRRDLLEAPMSTEELSRIDWNGEAHPLLPLLFNNPVQLTRPGNNPMDTDHAGLDLLAEGLDLASKNNVLLTGEAGIGKSFTLEHMLRTGPCSSKGLPRFGEKVLLQLDLTPLSRAPKHIISSFELVLESFISACETRSKHLAVLVIDNFGRLLGDTQLRDLCNMVCKASRGHAITLLAIDRPERICNVPRSMRQLLPEFVTVKAKAMTTKVTKDIINQTFNNVRVVSNRDPLSSMEMSNLIQCAERFIPIPLPGAALYLFKQILDKCMADTPREPILVLEISKRRASMKERIDAMESSLTSNLAASTLRFDVIHKYLRLKEDYSALRVIDGDLSYHRPDGLLDWKILRRTYPRETALLWAQFHFSGHVLQKANVLPHVRPFVNNAILSDLKGTPSTPLAAMALRKQLQRLYPWQHAAAHAICQDMGHYTAFCAPSKKTPLLTAFFVGDSEAPMENFAITFATFILGSNPAVFTINASEYQSDVDALTGSEDGQQGSLTQFIKTSPDCMVLVTCPEMGSSSLLDLLDDIYVRGELRDAGSNEDIRVDRAMFILISQMAGDLVARERARSSPSNLNLEGKIKDMLGGIYSRDLLQAATFYYFYPTRPDDIEDERLLDLLERTLIGCAELLAKDGITLRWKNDLPREILDQSLSHCRGRTYNHIYTIMDDLVRSTERVLFGKRREMEMAGRGTKERCAFNVRWQADQNGIVQVKARRAAKRVKRE